jgi:hypothetical protein
MIFDIYISIFDIWYLDFDIRYLIQDPETLPEEFLGISYGGGKGPDRPVGLKVVNLTHLQATF